MACSSCLWYSAWRLQRWLLPVASSVLLVLVAMGLLILQVWMFGRFFVNVLFWQQFAVLENAGFIDSLRESRDLARSGRDLPWFQRPLWRGAFIASIWFALCWRSRSVRHGGRCSIISIN